MDITRDAQKNLISPSDLKRDTPHLVVEPEWILHPRC